MSTRKHVRLPKLPPGAVCHYCKTAPGVTWDHVIPLFLFGRNHLDNLVPACDSCNAVKKDTWPTCRCSLCRSIVDEYLAQPGYLDYALDMVDRRLRLTHGGRKTPMWLSQERMLAERDRLTTTTEISKVET